MLRTLSSVCLFDSSSFLGLASCFGATSFPQSKLSAGDVDFGALDIVHSKPRRGQKHSSRSVLFLLLFLHPFLRSRPQHANTVSSKAQRMTLSYNLSGSRG